MSTRAVNTGLVATINTRLGATIGALRVVPTLPARVGAGTFRMLRGGQGRQNGRLLVLGCMAGALVLSAAGLAAVAHLRPGVASPRPMAVAKVPAPAADPMRRLRTVGEQLNLSTRTIGKDLFIYAGTTAGLQTASSLAHGAEPGPRIVSMPRISATVAATFRTFGFEVLSQTVDADSLTIRLTVQVPSTLRPLHDAVLERVKGAMALVPGLAAIQLDEIVKSDDRAFLLATLVGHPSSRAFTAEGAKNVGDPVLGTFTLRVIRTDGVEVASRAQDGQELRVTIPLRGESRLASGGLDAIGPAAFAAGILD